MADELQSLLDRIHDEGVRKAAAERDEILAKANEEAKALVAAARQEAEEIVGTAKKEADLLVEKGRESLRHGARDVLLSLRAQLETRVRAVADACVKEAASPEKTADLIADLAKAYLANAEEVTSLNVLLPSESADAIRSTLQKRLDEDLRAHCNLEPVPGISGGFKLVFNDEDIVYDFSDEALADALATFLNPRLGEIVRGG